MTAAAPMQVAPFRGTKRAAASMPYTRTGGRKRDASSCPDSFTALKGGGSIGRAAVSKTAGCRFESCPPCEPAATAGPRKVYEVARKIIDEPSEDVVANAKRDRAARRNPFARIALFIRQVIAELKKVVTPTRKELVSFTVVVLVFVIIMMALVWGLD